MAQQSRREFIKNSAKIGAALGAVAAFPSLLNAANSTANSNLNSANSKTNSNSNSAKNSQNLAISKGTILARNSS